MFATTGLALLPAPPVEAEPPELTAAFDWRMPERFGLDENADQLVDYRQSQGDLPWLFPDTWQVTLDACGSTPADSATPIVSYAWSIAGAQAESVPAASASCTAEVSFPAEGTYPATLTVTDSAGDSETKSLDVVVQDLLIVSVGDSIASGEGNPDKIEPNFGFHPLQATWQDERCHRSALAGTAQSALRLEKRDPRTSVTFVHFACSGAEVLTGLVGPYAGIKPDRPGSDATMPDGKIKPQLDLVHDLLVDNAQVDRPIDSMLVSIGANDLQFANIVKKCLALAHCHGQFPEDNPPLDGNELYEQNIVKLNGGGAVSYTDPISGAARSANGGYFGALDQTLDNHFVGAGKPIASADRVAITSYFDPTTDDDFNATVDQDGGDLRTVTPGWCDVPEIGLRNDETEWAGTVMMPGLNSEVQEAAGAHGWTFVENIDSAFRTHGYCAKNRWTRTLQESFLMQGGIDGAFHPNAEGHRFGYASRIEEDVVPLLGVGGVALPADASLVASDLANGFASFTSFIDELDAVNQLAQAPFIADAAGAVSDKVLKPVFEWLAARQAEITGAGHRSIRALNAYLNDPDGNGDLTSDGAAFGLNLDSRAFIVPEALSTAYRIQWSLEGTRSAPVPLDVQVGDFRLSGGNMQGEYGFRADFAFELDPSKPDGQKFALLTTFPDLSIERPEADVDEPFPQRTSGLHFDMALDADLSLLPDDFRLGVLDVDVSGTASLDAADDPNDTTDDNQGFDVSFADPTPADGRLTTADFQGASPATSLFQVSCAGSYAVQGSVNGMLPGDAGTAGGTASVTDGNFCDSTGPTTEIALGELGNFSNLTPTMLIEMVIALGTNLASLENSGQLDLPFVDTATSLLVDTDGALRAFLLTNGYATNPEDPYGSLQPSAFEDLSIFEFATQLATALSLDPAQFGLAYETGEDRLRFNMAHSATLPTKEIQVGLDEALAGLGINGAGDIAAKVTPSYGFDLGVLVDLSDLPANEDDLLHRVLLDTAGQELHLDVPVDVNVDVDGTIGFLGIALDDAAPAANGFVPLIRPRTGSDHMFGLDISAPGDVISLFDLATGLISPTSPLSTTAAVQVPPTTLTAAVTVGGVTHSCGISVSWADVAPSSSPAVAPVGDCFAQFLESFNFGDDPRALFGVLVDALRQAVASLEQSADAPGSPLRAELPPTGTTVAELVTLADDLLVKVDELLVKNETQTLQALEGDLEELVGGLFGTGATDVVDIALEPSTATEGPTVLLTLDFGACSEASAACDLVKPLPDQPFTLDFDIPGGIAGGATANGKISVDYSAQLLLQFGVTLPKHLTGTPSAFFTDDSKLDLDVTVDLPASANTSVAGSIGPVQLSLGTTGDPIVAHLGAGLLLENDPNGTTDRIPLAGLSSWAAGLLPPGINGATVDCDPATDSPPPPATGDGTANNDAFPACAHVPVYLGTSHLGDIDFEAPDLLAPSGWRFHGAQAIMDQLADEDFQWALLAQGLAGLADELAEKLDGSTYDLQIPLLGDQLDGGTTDQAAAGAGDTRISGLLRQASTALQTFATDTLPAISPPNLEGTIETWINDNLGPMGILEGTPNVTALCDDGRPAGSTDTTDPNTNETTTVTHGDNHDGPQPCATPFPSDTDTPGGYTRGNIVEVALDITLGQDVTQTVAKANFDIGLPGLRLAADENQQFTVGADWELDLSFGLSDADGFYLKTDRDTSTAADDAELSLSTGLRLPDTLTGELAFVPFRLDRTGTGNDVGVGLEIDLKGGSAPGPGEAPRLSLAALTGGADVTNPAELAARICGGVDLARTLSVGGAAAGEPGLPTFLADLGLTWQFGTCDGSGLPTGGTTPDSIGENFNVRFDNLRLDVGSFVSNFSKQLLGDILKYVGPVRPIIDELYAPVPLISDALEIVGVPKEDWPTWIDLISSISGNNLQMLNRVLEALRFADALANAATTGTINVGSFFVPGASAAGPAPPADQAGTLAQGQAPSAGFSSALTSQVPGMASAKSSGGFSFPAFDQPSTLFGYLLGKDVDLVKWDAGELNARYTLGAPLIPPIFIPFGPVVIKVQFSGYIGASGHFEVGYDTYGIRQALAAPDVGSGIAALFNGVFIDDYRNGKEVPEISLETGVSVSGSLDLLIAEGGARGTLAGKVNFDLRDEDGKMRILEIAQHFNRPICLFEIDALIELVLEVFAEIDVFLFSWSDAWEIVRLTLFEANDLLGGVCGSDAQPPDLATLEGGVLKLNMGPRAAQRHIATDQTNEAFTVRQLDSDSVEVAAFGITQRRDGVSEIQANGGSGDDVIRFLDGGSADGGNANSGSTPIPFTIGSRVCGGSANDVIETGGGVDTVFGDGTDTALVCAAGGSGTDSIEAGAGGDTVHAGGGTDKVNGGSGVDTLNGDGGTDAVLGGPDADTINGGSEGDTLSGGPEPFGATCGASGSGGTCPTAQDDARLTDTINGDGGNDTINGGFGFDILSGGDDDDTILGGQGNDTVNGDGGADVLRGDEHDDTINGGDDADTVNGGAGNDTLNGDAGSDTIVGEDGGDTIDGGDDDDTVFGDERPASGACAAGLVSTLSGNDNVSGGGGVDRLCGQNGDDTLNGGGAGDLLFGGRGRDTASGGDGVDEIHGEEDDDTLNGDADADVINGNAGNDTAHGHGGNDAIDGGTGNDVLHGDDDKDTVNGGTGDDRLEGDGNAAGQPDVLNGGAGADLLSGGGTEANGADDSDDTLNGEGGDDVIVGDNDQGALDRVPSVCLGLGAGDLGADTANGGPGNDTINGQAGNDALHGNEGNDLVFGELGNDEITGDLDFDTLLGDCGTATPTGQLTPTGAPVYTIALANHDTGGVDTISGGDHDDDLHGGAANDILSGGRGDDRIAGNGGSDTARGGLGADDIVGGTPVEGRADAGDLLFGEDGPDVISGDNALVERPLDAAGQWTVDPVRNVTERSIRLFDVQVAGGPAVAASVGDGDRIEGADDADILFGQAGIDTIHAGTDQDLVEGNHGNDIILGGSGADDLVGGGSADDGVIDDDRRGEGLLDGADAIDGDGGVAVVGESPSVSRDDVIAGDNARIDHPVVTLGGGVRVAVADPNRNGAVSKVILFDVETATEGAAAGTSGGENPIIGGPGRDRIYGQGGNDVVDAGAGDDVAEGNHGDDTMLGGPEADDLVGGGSSNTGHVNDVNRVGDQLLDGQDTLRGDGVNVASGDGGDAIGGDNARIDRPTDASGRWTRDSARNAPDRDITLYDVERSGQALPPAGTSAGEVIITGTGGNDLLYGQGGNDLVEAGIGDDVAEGNHGTDTVRGGAGADDLVGGGSSNAGDVDDRDRIGDGLLDGVDSIFGDDGPDEAPTDGGDVIGGDNARIVRPEHGAAGSETWVPDPNRADEAVREIRLFDIDRVGAPALAGTSGGENPIASTGGHDQVFGQGGNDVILSGTGDDVAEGNHGDDDVSAGEGADDVMGGSSAGAGNVGGGAPANGLFDGYDVVLGGNGSDAVAGDNAAVTRPTTPAGVWLPDPNRAGASLRKVVLFDVEQVGGTRDPGVAAGDTVLGEAGDDLLFGQGNLLAQNDDGDAKSDEDPVDGIDNDRDGREHGGSTGFDCLDGQDNDGVESADGPDPGCSTKVDEDGPDALAARQERDRGGDSLHGAEGHDVIEGNHGSDFVTGGPGQDDLTGGSSAGDGVVGGSVPPTGLDDGHDTMHGQDHDDVLIGDNGVTKREVAPSGVWQTLAHLFPAAPPASYGDVFARTTNISEVPEPARAKGDDWQSGGPRHDVVIGQEGHDYQEGNEGDDGLVGDLGKARLVLEDGSREQVIKTTQPFLTETVRARGTLTREVELFTFYDKAATDPQLVLAKTGAEGNDTMLGGDGDDAVHGGPGHDLMNGDGDGTRVPGPNGTFSVADPNPATTDRDQLWGGDGDDAMWGGRGDDDEWGGFGKDHIDVFPRPAFAGDKKLSPKPADPPEWFTYARADIFQGLDIVYGGWDQDAMQANFQETGPRTADRLLDWAGAYNVYYVCNGAYGDGSIIRALDPDVLRFLQELAAGRGAFDPATRVTSGHRETAIVFTDELKFNKTPVHPDHPGHFTCDGVNTLTG